MPGTAAARARAAQAGIRLHLWDGRREPFESEALIYIFNGYNTEIFRGHKPGPRLRFAVPFYNNLGDRYRVVATSPRFFKDAGFMPVGVSRREDATVHLMLIPKKTEFAFATWNHLEDVFQPIAHFLYCDGNLGAAKKHYHRLAKEDPDVLACVLNIATAMGQVRLKGGTALDYFNAIDWGPSMKRDRFYAYTRPELIDEVKALVPKKKFKKAPKTLHPGATVSYKQVQFGEANLQFSFHGRANDPRGLKVEIDMDYYRDHTAHFFGELIPNKFRGRLTDPKAVYVLRWIAGKQSKELDEFEPPYAIEWRETSKL